MGGLTGTHALISFLLDGQEKLEECLIVLKEFFGERSVLREVPIEKANSEANLGFGHFLCCHDRELEWYASNIKTRSGRGW